MVNLLKETSFNNFVYKKYEDTTVEEQKKRYERLDQVKNEKEIEKRAPVDVPIYFYHPDHLGTTNALTDVNGNMYQFFLNLPFGETMAEQTSISYYQTEFKFNGKELDSETGMYYYGARYYDPSLSIWMSVDPLAEQFPNFSPYNYTMNNPINMVDPDGRAPEIVDDDKPITVKPPNRTIKNTFKYDHNINGNDTASGTDFVTEAVVINTSGSNYKDQSVYTTQTVRTTMTVNAEGEISDTAFTEILISKKTMTEDGPKVTFEKINGVMKANLISSELKTATFDVQQKKLNNENTLSPVQVAANNVNLGLNFTLAVGTGGAGGYFLTGARVSAGFSGAVFIGTEVSGVSDFISPENIRLSYDVD